MTDLTNPLSKARPPRRSSGDAERHHIRSQFGIPNRDDRQRCLSCKGQNVSWGTDARGVSDFNCDDCDHSWETNAQGKVTWRGSRKERDANAEVQLDTMEYHAGASKLPPKQWHPKFGSKPHVYEPAGPDKGEWRAPCKHCKYPRSSPWYSKAELTNPLKKSPNCSKCGKLIEEYQGITGKYWRHVGGRDGCEQSALREERIKKALQCAMCGKQARGSFAHEERSGDGSLKVWCKQCWSMPERGGQKDKAGMMPSPKLSNPLYREAAEGLSQEATNKADLRGGHRPTEFRSDFLNPESDETPYLKETPEEMTEQTRQEHLRATGGGHVRIPVKRHKGFVPYPTSPPDYTHSMHEDDWRNFTEANKADDFDYEVPHCHECGDRPSGTCQLDHPQAIEHEAYRSQEEEGAEREFSLLHEKQPRVYAQQRTRPSQEWSAGHIRPMSNAAFRGYQAANKADDEPVTTRDVKEFRKKPKEEQLASIEQFMSQHPGWPCPKCHAVRPWSEDIEDHISDSHPGQREEFVRHYDSLARTGVGTFPVTPGDPAKNKADKLANPLHGEQEKWDPFPLKHLQNRERHQIRMANARAHRGMSAEENAQRFDDRMYGHAKNLAGGPQNLKHPDVQASIKRGQHGGYNWRQHSWGGQSLTPPATQSHFEPGQEIPDLDKAEHGKNPAGERRGRDVLPCPDCYPEGGFLCPPDGLCHGKGKIPRSMTDVPRNRYQ